MSVRVEGFEAPVYVANSAPGTIFHLDDGIIGIRVDVHGAQMDAEQLLVLTPDAKFELRPAQSISEPTWPSEIDLIIREDEEVGYQPTDKAEGNALVIDGLGVPWIRTPGPGEGAFIFSLKTFERGTPAMPVRVFNRWELVVEDEEGAQQAWAIGAP